MSSLPAGLLLFGADMEYLHETEGYESRTQTLHVQFQMVPFPSVNTFYLC
jgi:hypothetical protein